MINKTKTSGQQDAAAKACGSVSEVYNKYDIFSLMHIINYNAELLNILTEQIKQLQQQEEENENKSLFNRALNIYELKEAAKQIKEICKNYENCNKCPLYKKNNNCSFSGLPEKWEV